MKKIIFTLLAISLVSCSLEKRPDTVWGEDDYFKTEGQLKSLLNGGYVCMQIYIIAAEPLKLISIISSTTTLLHITSTHPGHLSIRLSSRPIL